MDLMCGFGLPTPRLALIFPLATKVASLLFRLATFRNLAILEGGWPS
jgi:hypothetical protein